MRAPRPRPRPRRRWPGSPRASTCRREWACRSERVEKPAALDDLIAALRCLPGVGPKSAQRMAYHLLQRDRKGAEKLSQTLAGAVDRIRNCARCNTFTEAEV